MCSYPSSISLSEEGGDSVDKRDGRANKELGVSCGSGPGVSSMAEDLSASW